MKLKADVFVVVLLTCSAAGGHVSGVNIHVDHTKVDCEKIEREWREKQPVRKSACERMTRKRAATLLETFKDKPIYWSGVDCIN